MGETTMCKQELATANAFLNHRNIQTCNWIEHRQWKVLKVGRVSIIFAQQAKKLTFQGEAKERIPLVEKFLIYKRERECKQQNLPEAEIESERHQIRENQKKMRYYESEDWERNEDEGIAHSHLKRQGRKE